MNKENKAEKLERIMEKMILKIQEGDAPCQPNMTRLCKLNIEYQRVTGHDYSQVRQYKEYQLWN